MTTLKSFQAEIEAISHEKHVLQIKEAREAHLAAELAKHHGKMPIKKEVEIPPPALKERHENEAEKHEEEASLEVSSCVRFGSRMWIDS